MQVLSSLRRRTKSGISAWNFCYNDETNVYFAVGSYRGGVKAIHAKNLNHLRAIYAKFVAYGYASKLPSKKQFISDPWASELPVVEQQALEALSA